MARGLLRPADEGNLSRVFPDETPPLRIVSLSKLVDSAVGASGPYRCIFTMSHPHEHARTAVGLPLHVRSFTDTYTQRTNAQRSSYRFHVRSFAQKQHACTAVVLPLHVRNATHA